MREAVSGIGADRLGLHVYCMQWFVSTSNECVWLALPLPTRCAFHWIPCLPQSCDEDDRLGPGAASTTHAANFS